MFNEHPFTKTIDSIFSVIPEEFFFELGTGHDEYLKSGNYYEWYYSIAKHYNPKSILEIGVRFGYSLMSMIEGSDDIQFVRGLDLESYERNSVAIAESNIKKYTSKKELQIKVSVGNSQELTSIVNKYDLIHIDGEHTYLGKIHDLEICLPAAKYILVDDYDHHAEVRAGIVDFVKMNSDKIENSYYVPTLRGMAVIETYLGEK